MNEVAWADLPTWVKGAADRSDRDLQYFRNLRWTETGGVYRTYDGLLLVAVFGKE